MHLAAMEIRPTSLLVLKWKFYCVVSNRKWQKEVKPVLHEKDNLEKLITRKNAQENMTKRSDHFAYENESRYV